MSCPLSLQISQYAHCVPSPVLTVLDRWDEWVPEQRLLKLNEEGFQKRRHLLEQQTRKTRPITAASPAASSVKGKEKGGKKAEAARKRARESGIDTVSRLSPFLYILRCNCDGCERLTLPQEADYLKRPEVKIVIPDILKLQLVDDWENVTKNNQLVSLPRKPNVRDLLEEYRNYVLATKKSQDRSS